jgi:hypothetical protein
MEEKPELIVAVDFGMTCEQHKLAPHFESKVDF